MGGKINVDTTTEEDEDEVMKNSPLIHKVHVDQKLIKSRDSLQEIDQSPEAECTHSDNDPF